MITDTRRASLLWIVLFTAASLVSSRALACMTPFAALAAVAALHLRARDGAALIGLGWGLNQAMGFGWMGYPHDALTVAWGGAIGLAALGALGGAYGALARSGAASLPARGAAAFVAAFVAFKLVLLAADAVLGGYVQSTIGLPVLLAQVPREALVTVLLLALYRGLVALGAPAAAAPRPALA